MLSVQPPVVRIEKNNKRSDPLVGEVLATVQPLVLVALPDVSSLIATTASEVDTQSKRLRITSSMVFKGILVHRVCDEDRHPLSG